MGGCNRPLKVALTPLKYQGLPNKCSWDFERSIDDLVKLAAELNESFMRSSFQEKLSSKLQAKLELSS